MYESFVIRLSSWLQLSRSKILLADRAEAQLSLSLQGLHTKMFHSAQICHRSPAPSTSSLSPGPSSSSASPAPPSRPFMIGHTSFAREGLSCHQSCSDQAISSLHHDTSNIRQLCNEGAKRKRHQKPYWQLCQCNNNHPFAEMP